MPEIVREQAESSKEATVEEEEVESNVGEEKNPFAKFLDFVLQKKKKKNNDNEEKKEDASLTWTGESVDAELQRVAFEEMHEFLEVVTPLLDGLDDLLNELNMVDPTRV